MRGNQAWFVRDFLGRNRHIFVVPVYQRNCDWNKVQCTKLYEDILEAKERDKHHFMGYIAYAKEYNSEKDLNELLMIDGQQRIATMYILLKAMLDISIKNKETLVENDIKDIIFNRNCGGKDKMKLVLNKEDNKQIKLLFSNKIGEMDKDSNIFKNYKCFEALILNSLDGKRDLGDIMEGIKKLEIFEAIFDTDMGDVPQEVFESINSTGIELTVSDLVKNFLLMETDRQKGLYEKYWLKIESNVGTEKINDFMMLFVNSLTINSIARDKAYDGFKKIFEEGNYTCEEMLDKLTMLSKCFAVYIGNKDFYSSKIQDYLHGLYYMKQERIMTLVFRFFEDFETGNIDEETLTKVMECTLTYAVRISVTGSVKGLPALMTTIYNWAIKNNNYENYYEKFVAHFNVCNDRTNNKMPSDEQFRDALVKEPLFRKDVCKYLFTVLENNSKENFKFNSKPLEHILPSRILSDWDKKVEKEDYLKVYETYLHTLGNLTHTGYEGPAKDIEFKSFRDKKAIIKLNSPNSILNRDILSAEIWDKEAVENRANKLADILIHELFPYVPTPDGFDDRKEEVCYNLADIEFPITFYPTQAVMLGNVKNVKNWSDVWEEFVRIAYESKNAEITKLIFKGILSKYFAPEGLQERLKSPKQIKKSAIFFESKISDAEIIDTMKDLIKKLNMDISEFNFYENN